MSELEGLLASLDDALLASLTSVGLVKRARKDLEREAPRREQGWEFTVEGQRVTLVAPLARSRCACPAPGLCRHILTAMLFAQSQLAESAQPFDPSEVLAVTQEQLQAWAGKKLLTQARERLAEGFEFHCEVAGSSGVLRLTWHNYECRWVRGGGLEGMACNCHAQEPCLHRVACLLAMLGLVRPQERSALEASGQAPRSRSEVLESLGLVLQEMAALGWSRLSSASAERLRTLAVSAHGVDLPRLEKLVRSLSDEVGYFLERDGRASSAGLLATAAWTEALRSGLLGEDPPAALVGVHRARYYEVPGSLELCGVGARRFQTRSGYLGLTVYFLDGSGQWLTWSEARLGGQGGFDPLTRYRQEGPWENCPDPRRASRSRLRLSGAFRSRAGGLSGRPSSRAMLLGATPAQVLRQRAVRDWSDLPGRELFATGLQESGPLDRLVVLEPAVWGPPQFDLTEQRLRVAVADEKGRRLSVELAHGPIGEPAIRWLEQADLQGAVLLGMLTLGRQLAVEPITLLRGEELFHLNLDSASGSTPGQGQAALEEVEELEEEERSPAGSSRLALWLGSVLRELEDLAEAGVRSSRPVDGLLRLEEGCRSVGMEVCAGALQRVRERRTELVGGQALLQAYYTTLQAERLAGVQEVLG